MRCSGRCWAGSSGVGSGDVSYLRLAFRGQPERRLQQIGPFGAGPAAEFDISAVMDPLNDLSDEACEETHDHCEWNMDLEQCAIRIWFGVVPPGSPACAWRDVLPELASIHLSSLGG